MGNNAVVVVCTDTLSWIENDPSFGKNLAASILEHVNGNQTEGPHNTRVIDLHHSSYYGLIMVGGNSGHVLPGVVNVNPEISLEEQKLDMLKSMADQMGYAIRKKPQRKGK